MRKLILLFVLFFPFVVVAQQTHYLWSKPFQGKFSEYSVAEARDTSGCIYVTGYFEDSTWFEYGNDATLVVADGSWNTDVFIAKYFSDGQLDWVKRIGGPLSDKPTALQISKQGDIFISGLFSAQVDFDPNPGIQLRNSAGGTDAFILKLDNRGDFKFVYTCGSTEFDRLMDISIDDTNLVAIGDFQQAVDFDAYGSHLLLNAAGESDVCVIQMNTTGNVHWVKQLSGLKSEYGAEIEYANHFIVCGGSFEGSIDADPSSVNQQLLTAYPALSGQGSPFDVYILMLSPDGNFSWVKQIGGKEDQELTCLAVDQQKIYVTYNFNYLTYADLPSTTVHVLQPLGDYDMVLQSFSLSGAVQDVTQVGGPQADYISSIYIDKEHSLYCAGFFSGTCDFDPSASHTQNLQVNTFDGNAFLLKLTDNLNFRWVKQWVSDGFSYVGQVLVDDTLSIYSIGHWTSSIRMDPDQNGLAKSSKGLYDGFLHKMSQCDVVDSLIELSGCDSLFFNNQWYSQSGNYDVKVLSALRCDTTYHIQVKLITTEEPDYVVSAQTCTSSFNGKLEIQTINPLNVYQLLPGQHPFENNQFTLLAPGKYTLFIKDTNQCVHKEPILIPEENCCDDPFVPNAFTPNQDGINDYLNILHISKVEVKQFVIYNRFGNEVFRNKDLWGWDGKYKNEEAEIGTYFYYLHYTCLQTGKEHILKGSFELLR